jgi:hypothetical protein
MTDGYKYIDVFYETVQTEFNVELNATLTGQVEFCFVFYADAQFTEYVGEMYQQTLVNGLNVLQTSNPLSLYMIARIKLLHGSSASITSLKINNLQHIHSGLMFIENPPITFTPTTVVNVLYQSTKLYQINDPDFNFLATVQEIVGHVDMEILYYDESYTTLHSIQSVPVLTGQRFIQVNRTNKFVLFRFKLANGSRITFSSLKMNGVEQFNTNVTFTANIEIRSEICFPAGTHVKTDQGSVEIQKLIPHFHKIMGKPIVAVTATYSYDDELVCIQKGAFRKNYPSSLTYISKKHKVYLKGKLKAAYRLIKHKGVSFVPYEGNILYNVLLDEYGLMSVNGMLCETLHPDNPVGQIFREMNQPKIKIEVSQ